jgi:hypothetical protein
MCGWIDWLIDWFWESLLLGIQFHAVKVNGMLLFRGYAFFSILASVACICCFQVIEQLVWGPRVAMLNETLAEMLGRIDSSLLRQYKGLNRWRHFVIKINCTWKQLRMEPPGGPFTGSGIGDVFCCRYRSLAPCAIHQSLSETGDIRRNINHLAVENIALVSLTISRLVCTLVQFVTLHETLQIVVISCRSSWDTADRRDILQIAMISCRSS